MIKAFKICLIAILIINYCRAQSSSTEAYDRSAHNCGIRSREKCLEPLRRHLAVKHISYGRNEREIANTCKKIQRVILCLEKVLDECRASNARIKDNIEKLLSGHRSLQYELCDSNSTFRQRYFRYVQCIERYSQETIKCYRNYEKEMIGMMHEIPFQKQKFGFVQTDSFCCALDRHNGCTRRILESRCNSSAADMAEELFRVSRGDISGECNQNNFFRDCNGFHKLNDFNLLFNILFFVTMSLTFNFFSF